MRKRLYLSGPITGIENYEEIFQNATNKLLEMGFSVINPAPLYRVLPIDATYEEYMSVDLKFIDMVEGIVLLPGWEMSRGSNRELGYALASNKEIMYYNKMIDEDEECNSATV